MTSWQTEQEGSTGENVESIQYLLNARGVALAVDSKFGQLTTTAVEHFQAQNGLTPDGVVGPLTWPKLIMQVQSGSDGDAVKAVQAQINTGTAEVRIPILVVDGIFGPQTDSAVRTFQTENQLTVDGIVGPMTWQTMIYWEGPSS